MQYIDGKPQFTPLKTIRSRRLVMLTQETCLALQKHWELLEIKKSLTPDWADLGLVFPGKLGGFLSPKTDYKYWQKALRLCGIAPKRLHDARHTAATLMYSQGVGIETISRALGHSSSAITSRLYVHTAEEPLRRAANAIDQMLRN
jgi:integrase